MTMRHYIDLDGWAELKDQSKHVLLGRKLGYTAASFEINDRPLYENFMDGLGFAYALGLAARLCHTAPRRKVKHVRSL